MTTTRLKIERMGYGPEAIAHDADGKTVFVTGGVPGDTVEAEIDADEARFSRAHVTKVLEASPDRVTPPCPFVDVCGGCPWAHLSYEAQLAAKRSGVVDALTRLGGFSAEDAEALVAPIVAPGEPWGYRNKVELAVVTQRGRAVVGMHAAGSAGVVKVPSCPLLDSKFKGVVKAVQGAMNFLAGSRDLGLERVGIRASRRTKELEVALWGAPGPFPRPQVAKVLGDATKVTSVVRVMQKGPAKARRIAGVERLSGKGSWGELVGSESMRVSAPSFFQVNTRGSTAGREPSRCRLRASPALSRLSSPTGQPCETCVTTWTLQTSPTSTPLAGTPASSSPTSTRTLSWSIRHARALLPTWWRSSPTSRRAPSPTSPATPRRLPATLRASATRACLGP